jgi:hypothetical protein
MTNKLNSKEIVLIETAVKQLQAEYKTHGPSFTSIALDKLVKQLADTKHIKLISY